MPASRSFTAISSAAYPLAAPPTSTCTNGSALKTRRPSIITFSAPTCVSASASCPSLGTSQLHELGKQRLVVRERVCARSASPIKQVRVAFLLAQIASAPSHERARLGIELSNTPEPQTCMFWAAARNAELDGWQSGPDDPRNGTTRLRNCPNVTERATYPFHWMRVSH